jgi:hypothetical protein
VTAGLRTQGEGGKSAVWLKEGLKGHSLDPGRSSLLSFKLPGETETAVLESRPPRDSQAGL